MARQQWKKLGLALVGVLIFAPAGRVIAQPEGKPPKVIVRIGGDDPGHTDRLDHVAFSADGRFFATAGSFTDHSVCVWNAGTGKRVFRAEIRVQSFARGIGLSEDGKKLAALAQRSDFGAEATLYVWDVATGKVLLDLPFGKWRIQRRAVLVFSPDATTIAAAGPGLTLVDLSAGKVKIKLALKDEVGAVAFHPEGKLVAGAGEDVHFWDTASGKPRGRVALQETAAIAFAPDGKSLAFSAAGTVLHRTLSIPKSAAEAIELGPPREVVKFPRGEVHLAFSPDSKRLLTAGSVECQEFEIASGKSLHRWSRPGEWVSALTFRDGKPVAATRPGNEARVVRLWNVATGDEFLPRKGHAQTIAALAFAPGDLLISAAEEVRFWNVRSSKQVAQCAGDDRVGSLIVMPGGKEIAAVGKAVTWWSLPEGKKLRAYQPKPIAFGYLPALFPDGRTLAAPVIEFKESKESAMGYDWSMKGASLINPENGKETRRMNGVDQLQLRVGPNGQTLAAIGYGIQFWDIKSGASLYQSPNRTSVTAVAFSNDGKHAASCQFLTITVWNVATRQITRTWKLPRGEFIAGYWSIGPILAFSPDGRMLAIGTPRGSIRLHNAKDGKCLTSFPAHNGSVRALAFRPDGHALASGGTDRSITIWDLAADRPKTSN